MNKRRSKKEFTEFSIHIYKVTSLPRFKLYKEKFPGITAKLILCPKTPPNITVGKRVLYFAIILTTMPRSGSLFDADGGSILSAS